METELPRFGDATINDLQLAVNALGSYATYGGFVRAALAGIYAERERAGGSVQPKNHSQPREG